MVLDHPYYIKGETLNDLSDDELNDLAMYITLSYKEVRPDAELLGSGNTYINNEKAIWYLITETQKHAFIEFKLKSLFFVTIHNGKMYQITCGAEAERFSKFEDIFLKTVWSFVFEDAFMD